MTRESKANDMSLRHSIKGPGRHPRAALGLAALLAVSACMQTPLTGDEIVAQCQAEVNPAGTYEYDPAMSVPVMTAVEDGTEAGARAFNACIRAKASGARTAPAMATATQTGASCPNGAATLFGGNTYCIGSN